MKTFLAETILESELNSDTNFQNDSLQFLNPNTSIPNAVKHFPKTRYYGSKRRLLGWIYSKLKNLKFETVLDAFGGTASVSQLFCAMQKKVYYHDAFNFNFDVATTLLSPDVALTKTELIKCLSDIKPLNSLISLDFKGVFYTDDENAWLDGFMTEINSSDLSNQVSSLLRYLVYQACLKKRPFNLFHRANLNLRTNRNVKRSFGNSTTWENSFVNHMIQTYDELLYSRTQIYPEATVLPANNAIEIPNGFDLVYLDPPYVSLDRQNNSDDYWKKYHFLEGLSSYKNWEEKIDPKSIIRMMPTPQHFLVWSRNATFKEALFDLISLHSSSIVILSYVKNAYPSENDIREYFESLFSEVYIHSIEHSHALSNSPKIELLYIGLP